MQKQPQEKLLHLCLKNFFLFTMQNNTIFLFHFKITFERFYSFDFGLKYNLDTFSAQECPQDIATEWEPTCFNEDIVRTFADGKIQHHLFITWVVCSFQSVFLLIEAFHDLLPTGVDIIKFGRLMRQLLTYVLCLKYVLKDIKNRRKDKTDWCLFWAITGVFTNTCTHRKSTLTATVYSPHQRQENRCVTVQCSANVCDAKLSQCIWTSHSGLQHIVAKPLTSLIRCVVLWVVFIKENPRMIRSVKRVFEDVCVCGYTVCLDNVTETFQRKRQAFWVNNVLCKTEGSVCSFTDHVNDVWCMCLCVYLQIHPLPLYSEDHFNDFQHKRQTAFPVVNFLFKCFDKAGCFHYRQGHLVILQSLEHFLCSPVYTQKHVCNRRNKYGNKWESFE